MNAINAGDTAWVLIATAMVFFMTPGLAFFYGGLVRRKNILSVLMQCFILGCAISLVWVLLGYSLAFGPDKHGLIGSFAWAGLRGVGVAPSDYAATIPHLQFMAFQMMFAVITPALIVGAFAERINFAGFLVFSILWSLLVYAPIAHWVWGAGGWLYKMHALDFAGGSVVHISAGAGAIATAVLVGKRTGYEHEPQPPHSLPFTVLGTGILWFGWFGFNAGSALAANGTAALAFVNTNTAAAAAGFTWAVLDWWHTGRPTLLGVATGIVGGLVAITPACGFVSPLSAIAIGVSVSIICFCMVVYVKPKLGYDDSLDAFGVHGVGGLWGTIATGIFASKAVNEAGANGLIHGNPAQLWTQFVTGVIPFAFALVMSIILFKIVDALIGMRAHGHDELVGLDLSQHREAGYTVLE
ncbi:MAG TPA: ammonium transporter [Holophaga sp.]|nr:ammonium transporter [Holophaga sp.]